jgi:hypothetical protein
MTLTDSECEAILQKCGLATGEYEPMRAAFRAGVERAMEQTVNPEELKRRVQAVLDCPASMCGHCIEILTGEIPSGTTHQEFVGPCTEFSRNHLYQIGCSTCGKLSSEHPVIR